MLDGIHALRKTGRPIVTTVLILGLMCCTPHIATPRTISSAAVTRVEVVQPVAKMLERVVEQPGTVQPEEETNLFARVPGYVGKVFCDIGQKVRGPRYDAQGKLLEPGQVLIELSVPELEEETNHKLALVRLAEAEVELMKRAEIAAEATIGTREAVVAESKATEDRWGSEARRIAKMVQSGVIDIQTGDETRNQYRASAARVQAAQADVRRARADRDKAGAEIASAEARVGVAKAEARRLTALLGYARIRAPFDGVVTRRKVNTGDTAHPTATRSDYLLTVTRQDPVRIVVEVPEADAAVVVENAAVVLNIPALRRTGINARIARTSWALTPGARTLRAEIDLPNKEGKLRPGMYVQARITGEQPAGWVLPTQALVKQGDALVCFRIEGGKAVRTPVQAGRTDARSTEVLKYQRLPATTWEDWTGKEVIASKASGLTDGESVEAMPEAGK